MSEYDITKFKEAQRQGWKHFAPLEVLTTPAAAKLVKFANVRAGEHLLDVGCGTGVAAITAARVGARACSVDLTPELLESARENAHIANVEIEFSEGDAEALPFDDAAFDVVLSQFGHMFAPRPNVAIGEMLRVLRARRHDRVRDMAAGVVDRQQLCLGRELHAATAAGGVAVATMG